MRDIEPTVFFKCIVTPESPKSVQECLIWEYLEVNRKKGPFSVLLILEQLIQTNVLYA